MWHLSGNGKETGIRIQTTVAPADIWYILESDLFPSENGAQKGSQVHSAHPICVAWAIKCVTCKCSTNWIFTVEYVIATGHIVCVILNYLHFSVTIWWLIAVIDLFLKGQNGRGKLQTGQGEGLLQCETQTRNWNSTSELYFSPAQWFLPFSFLLLFASTCGLRSSFFARRCKLLPHLTDRTPGC